MTNKMWTKAGLLITPDPNIWWMTQHVGPSFLQLQDDGRFDLYVTGRDIQNVSRIGVIQGEVVDHLLLLGPPPADPLFDVGDPGCFDESGVSYPWLVHCGNETLMFYVGWVASGKTGFQNYTGLAVSTNGCRSFERVGPVPILDRTKDEPYGSGSCAVIYEESQYIMLYTSFYRWKDAQYKTRQFAPSYDIKLAYSDDGRTWTRNGDVAIALIGSETIVGKPSILKREDGSYIVYFSARGENYKIFRADGPSLRALSRVTEVDLDTSPEGWDSQMVEYSHVVENGRFRFMIYNGNDFGKTGLGYAWTIV